MEIELAHDPSGPFRRGQPGFDEESCDGSGESGDKAANSIGPLPAVRVDDGLGYGSEDEAADATASDRDALARGTISRQLT